MAVPLKKASGYAKKGIGMPNRCPIPLLKIASGSAIMHQHHSTFISLEMPCFHLRDWRFASDLGWFSFEGVATGR